ncbi:MAG: hypothetical protein Q4D02_01150 [Clostridia bacterium]|nr:hypothetical protein [Clostridia bacterium]
MKKIKDLLKYILIFGVVLSICMLSLYFSCLIPSSKLKANIGESLPVIMKFGSKLHVAIFHKIITFDTFADAMMINTAYSIDSKHPFYSMLFARSNYVDGVTSKTYQDEACQVDKLLPAVPQVDDLVDLTNGENLIAIEYARYWHGYLVYLRPLLTLFNYNEIRIISFIFHYILISILLYYIKKKIGKKYLIAVIFGMVVTEGYLVYTCLEETIGYSFILIESIFLLRVDIKNYEKYFFVVGMLTAFFDLLTIPVVILLFPLILYVLINPKENVKLLIKKCIKYCILFGIGYASMWFSKWLFVDAIYGRNLIKNAIGQAIYRVDGTKAGLSSALIKNLYYIGIPVAVYIGIIYLINIIMTIYEKIRFKKLDKTLQCNLLLEIIGILPIVWYIVVREHSLGHAYFTYRNLLATCMSTQIMMINLIDQRVKKYKSIAFAIFIMIDIIVIILKYYII